MLSDDSFKFPQGHINTLRIICVMWKNNGVNRYKESLQSVQGFNVYYTYILTNVGGCGVGGIGMYSGI